VCGWVFMFVCECMCMCMMMMLFIALFQKQTELRSLYLQVGIYVLM